MRGVRDVRVARERAEERPAALHHQRDHVDFRGRVVVVVAATLHRRSRRGLVGAGPFQLRQGLLAQCRRDGPCDFVGGRMGSGGFRRRGRAGNKLGLFHGGGV